MKKFTVRNTNGEVFSRIDAPSAITLKIDEAISRKARSGSVAGAGHIWRWRTLPEDTIRLEFTRGDMVVQGFEISAISWQAFGLVAARNGKDPKSYLALLLATCLSEGDDLERVIEWLFTTADTSAQEVQAPTFTTHRVE